MPDPSMSLRPVVTCNGQVLPEEQLALLREFRVTQGLGVPAYARFAFVAQANGPEVAAKLGDELVLTIDGGPSDGWTMFDGVVVGMGVELDTGFDQTIVIEAYDKLYKLGRTSQAATYLEKSAADIVKELARKAGLTAQVDSKFGTAVRKSAYQYGTAYAYIDALVREAGFEWHVSGSKLLVTPRAGSSATEVPVTVGDNLRRFNARVSATDHVGEVTVTGWDIVKKEAIVGVATSDGKGARSEVDVASAATVKKSTVAGTKALSIPRPVADQAEAKALATGIMHRREAGLLRARGEVIPEQAVVPGVQLVLKGLAGQWDGKYYCTEVEHIWGSSEGSLRTFFEVGSAEPESLVDLFGGTGSATVDRMLGGLTVGIVTNNKDPEKLNRVKVKLPYLSDQEETSWARVLQPGAGKGRGWNVLPEVDDEVLIGFEHGDIDHPYVLGGLVNGKDKPPYLGADGDLLDGGKVAARTFSSRLGHEIYVADGSGKDKQYVKVKTAKDEATLFLGAERIDLESKGIPVKVFNDKGSIEITKDGDINITGNTITLDAKKDVIIKAVNIKSDSKMNTQLKAGGEVLAKGTAGATLDGGITATVKGGMVKIN